MEAGFQLPGGLAVMRKVGSLFQSGLSLFEADMTVQCPMTSFSECRGHVVAMLQGLTSE